MTINNNNSRSFPSMLGIALGLMLLMATMSGMAAAQTVSPDDDDTCEKRSGVWDEDCGSFCQTPFAAAAVNWIVGLVTQGVIATALITWVATNFGESLPLVGKSLQKAMKQQRMQSISSAVQALFLPGLFVVFLSQIGIGVPKCLDLVPFL